MRSSSRHGFPAVPRKRARESVTPTNKITHPCGGYFYWWFGQEEEPRWFDYELVFGAAIGVANNWSINAAVGLADSNVSYRAGTNYKFKLF